jgi:hypothetical protein
MSSRFDFLFRRSLVIRGDDQTSSNVRFFWIFSVSSFRLGISKITSEEFDFVPEV